MARHVGSGTGDKLWIEVEMESNLARKTYSELVERHVLIGILFPRRIHYWEIPSLDMYHRDSTQVMSIRRPMAVIIPVTFVARLYPGCAC